MKQLVKDNIKYSTYQLCDVSMQNILCSHIYIAKLSEREQIADELLNSLMMLMMAKGF